MINTLTAAAAAFALTVAPTTSGTGWSLSFGVTHLGTEQWNVVFYDTYSRDQVDWHAANTVSELNKYTDVTFVLTDNIRTYSMNECPPDNHLGEHRLLIRIDPNEDRGWGAACQLNGEAWGGVVNLSKDRWLTQERNGQRSVYRRNVVSHEMAHAIGVGHPADCTLPGWNPLMCGDHWYGYRTNADGWKYTSYDVKALNALVDNRVEGS